MDLHIAVSGKCAEIMTNREREHAKCEKRAAVKGLRAGRGREIEFHIGK